MVFSSLEFICFFLPVVFILHCIMPSINLKNVLLIIASLLFYAYGEPTYVLLMIASAFFNYMLARIVTSSKYKKLWLFFDVFVNLGVLFFFKYMTFLIETLNYISGQKLGVINVELPIGISFFTFQALSYVIDVYYGKVQFQKSFWKVLLYISFFPQLIAGPIVKYRDISDALSYRKIDIEQIFYGIRRFICGLGKKVLIANVMGQAADTVFNADRIEVNILVAWVGAISYMLQIYYDFSGYSDMAIGLGKMFGFQFQENFKYPYGALSIKEFWRRWHISLSTWFKEYLYIPLGGNRKGRLRTGINKVIVFFCTGLWHGANWTFIVWGLYHGFFSILEEYIPFTKKIPKQIAYIYTMLVVCIGFVIFRANTLTQGIYIINQMFLGFSFNNQNISFVTRQLTPYFITMVFAGIIGMASIKPVVEFLNCKQHRAIQTLISTASIMLLAWCIIRLSGNTYNPFIYFRF